MKHPYSFRVVHAVKPNQILPATAILVAAYLRVCRGQE